MKRFGVRSFIVGCASAALLSAAACSNNNANTSTATPNDTSARAAAEPDAKGTSGIEAQAVNATGCLQKKGGDYILTAVNEPSTGGASTAGQGDKVGREQLHAAQHAYRLNANRDDDLAKLVGKQVRISGTMQKPSDLAPNASRDTAATSGSTDRADRDRRDISAGDLARVDVTSIEQVAASCGSSARSPKHKR